MNLKNIRSWQFQIMQQNMDSLTAILQEAPAEVFGLYRDGGTGWTALQVMGHLRDFEALFLQRARLTVEHDNPSLPFPNPDELAAAQDYNNIPMEALLDEFRGMRFQHLEFLQGLDETAFDRVAQHPTRGDFTLHDQLFLTTLHDSIHTEQLTRILADKRDS